MVGKHILTFDNGYGMMGVLMIRSSISAGLRRWRGNKMGGAIDVLVHGRGLQMEYRLYLQ